RGVFGRVTPLPDQRVRRPTIVSREYGLAQLVATTTWKVITLACVAGLLTPASPADARRRRSAHASGPSHRHGTRKPVTAHKSKGRSKRVKLYLDDASLGSRGTVDEHIHLRRGDTLASVLTARGIGVDEASPWLKAANDAYDLRTLHPHRGLTLRFDRATR